MNPSSIPNAAALRRIRRWLAVFIVGLIVSGLTAFLLESELRWLAAMLGAEKHQPAAHPAGLRDWIVTVRDGLIGANQRWPFLAYGTDWLAFAHLVIAVAFIGPWRDPWRNRFVVGWGLFCCAAIIPLALIAGHFRGIPFPWRLVDCSFGIFGAIPLLMVRREIRRSPPSSE